MSIETMLITAALSLLTLLLPSAAGHAVRDYCIARGKTRALLLLPGLWLGNAIACGLAVAALIGLRLALPAMQAAFDWIGIAIFFIFILRAQVQRLRLRVADNDNLPRNGAFRTAVHITLINVHPALVLALCALIMQMADSSSPHIELAQNLLTAMAFAAFAAPIVQVAFAARSARKAKAFHQQFQASRKAPTRFIASRAVTAGYRRIAA
ncbi:hypothetical protein ACFSE1_16065 [Rhizobium helianthi]|uniref:Lysine transporter LysE n=1 Tax=Rhizobium helianthi TaxID=1132695 RepID=A0ABW4M6M3_9HYPH